MSIIAQQDYPDYGRQVAQSDILLYEEIDTSIAAFTLLPVRFAAASPWLGIQFTSGATASELLLSWSADEDGNRGMGVDPIVITSAAGAYLTLPIKGPYVQAMIDLAAYPDDFFLTVATIPNPVTQWSQFQGNRIIETVNETIAAAATTTLFATGVVSGLVNITTQMRAGTVATAALFWTGFSGARTQLDRWRVEPFAPVRTLYVPPFPLELDVTNNDAGAQVLDASVRHATPGTV